MLALSKIFGEIRAIWIGIPLKGFSEAEFMLPQNSLLPLRPSSWKGLGKMAS